MKKMIALILCLMLCLAVVPVYAGEVGQTGESLMEQAKALIAAEDYQGAAELLKKAAETGDAIAQYALGDCYAYGAGVDQDDQKAAEYYTLAADQGYAPAQAALGIVCLNGLGVEANPETALKYFRLAADQNDPAGQYYMAYCYDAGVAVEQDAEKALEYYAKKAESVRYSNPLLDEYSRMNRSRY